MFQCQMSPLCFCDVFYVKQPTVALCPRPQAQKRLFYSILDVAKQREEQTFCGSGAIRPDF